MNLQLILPLQQIKTKYHLKNNKNPKILNVLQFFFSSDYDPEDTCCKISIKNFIAFAETWLEIKKIKTPFALIYQDENDWIDAKPFETQEEMEQFIKDHS